MPVNELVANLHIRLWQAAADGNANMITFLASVFLAEKININKVDGKGMTALMLAAGKGHVDAVNVLLRAGADINVVVPNGATALTYATVNGHDNVISILRGAAAKGHAELVPNFDLAEPTSDTDESEISEISETSSNTSDHHEIQAPKPLATNLAGALKDPINRIPQQTALFSRVSVPSIPSKAPISTLSMLLAKKGPQNPVTLTSAMALLPTSSHRNRR